MVFKFKNPGLDLKRLPFSKAKLLFPQNILLFKLYSCHPELFCTKMTRATPTIQVHEVSELLQQN